MTKLWRSRWIFCLSLLLFFSGRGFAEERPMRSLFVSVIQDPPVLSSRQAIDNLILFSKKAQVRELFVQVYRENKAWFPSSVGDSAPYEACLKSVGEDPLALLIRKAHAEGIEVHAWVNLMSLGSNQSAPLLKKYGATILTRNLEPKKSLKDYKIDNQFFLDPGDPRVRKEIVKMIGEIVSTYHELDGIQLDYIRYPDWKPAYGYNAKNVERYKAMFNTQKINPKSQQWQQWKRDQVTTLVREIAARARKLHPGIRVSTTGLVSYTRANWEAYQDWRHWVREGLIDFVTLMCYAHEDTPRYQRYIQDAQRQLGDLTKANIAVGSYRLLDQPQVFDDQWDICEETAVRSCAVFHYGDLLQNPVLARSLK